MYCIRNGQQAKQHCFVHAYYVSHLKQSKQKSGAFLPVDAVESRPCRLFQGRRDEQALEKYTRSVAVAPPDGDCLAVAFANRSAVALRTGEYASCVRDVDRALGAGYPARLRYKLHERRARALLRLCRGGEAARSVDTATQCLDAAEMDAAQRDAHLAALTALTSACQTDGGRDDGVHSDDGDTPLPAPVVTGGSNEAYPSLATSCDVASEDGCGRFIAAARDVSPGDVIVTERPYASVLLAAHRWSHCHHCLRRSAALLPCARCADAMFCGEACLRGARSYHQVECACLATLREAGVGKWGHLALRTVVVAGGVPAGGDGPTTPYRWDDFGAVARLVSHTGDRTTADLFRRAVTAAALTLCLQRTGYLPAASTTGTTAETTATERRVGGLLLSLLQILPCNAHEVSELRLNLDAVAASTSVETGAAIYATLSLFNHSCDPAVVRHFYGDVCVVRAIKSVKRGDELADNYGVLFALQTRTERREKLKAQYHFECRCTACTHDWPLYQHLMPAPRWKCAHCSCSIDSGAAKPACARCGTAAGDHLRRLAATSATYRTAFKDLEAGGARQAQPVLARHLAELDELVCLPWLDYCSAQEALKQCFAIMANCVTVKSA